jgi:hypothetical protein
MINSVLKYVALFLLLLLIQLLIMDNIQFSGYINPYIYLLFIILLPFETSAITLLLLSFFTGLTVDLFSGTPGLHTSATLVAGFIRPYLLRSIAPHDDYEKGGEPGLKTYGIRWFFIYVSVMVVFHHFTLFYLEVFRFAQFFSTLLRVSLSSIFTIGFVLIIQSLIIRR